MSEWIQYLPHTNCVTVLRFVGMMDDADEIAACCVEEGPDAPLALERPGGGLFRIRPGEWIERHDDGTWTWHKTRPEPQAEAGA